MPIMHNPESEYSKELERWNTPRRLGGMRPDGFEAFPTMLYRAMPALHRNGKVMCGDPAVAVGDPEAETFTRKCQLEVKNHDDLDRALKAGWCGNPAQAVEMYEAAQQAIAAAAANAAFHANRMSESAKDEFHQTQTQADGYEHVPDPPAPKKPVKGTRVEL